MKIKNNNNSFWSGTKKTIFVTIICLILAIAVIFLPDSVKENSYIDYASFLISIVAFAIAGFTYFSIDVVNTISSMEGNVLSNEQYNVAYHELIHKYEVYTSMQKFDDAVCHDIKQLFMKKKKTCIEFSDDLQAVIDLILWFAYCGESHFIELDELIDNLHKKNLRLQDGLNGGDRHLLEENVKLIHAVLEYQFGEIQKRRKESGKDMIPLLDVRGDMLYNKVAKIVYYDYLGLEYLKKCRDALNAIVDFDKDAFYPESIQKIYQHVFSTEEREQVQIYIDCGMEAFCQAYELAKGDILWEGYIFYNQARMMALKAIIEKKMQDDCWINKFQEAIYARKKVMVLFCQKKAFKDSVQEEDNSYLLHSLRSEYDLACAMFYMLKKYSRGLSEEEVEKLGQIKEHNEKYGAVKLKSLIASYLETI